MKPITRLLSYFLLIVFLASFNANQANAQCPTAGITYAGSPYCSNAGTARVTLTGSAGGSFTAIPNLNIDANTGDVDLFNNTPGTYSVIYVISANNNCEEFRTTAEITITAAPNASFYYYGSPYFTCETEATPSFSGTTGGTFSSTAGLSIDPATGRIDIASSQLGTYTVTYTVAPSGGCDVYSNTAPVTIQSTPATSVSYPNTPYCTNFGVATSSVTGVLWGHYTSSPAGLSLNYKTGEINTTTSTPGTYTVSYDAGYGACATSVQTTVDIVDPPTAFFSYPNPPYCTNGGTAMPGFIGTTGGIFRCETDLVALDPTTGNIDLAASTPGTYTINYSIHATGGCGESITTATITIGAPPAATISYPYSPYCVNSGFAKALLVGDGGGTFSADPGLSIDPNTGMINTTASTPGTYTVTYTVTNSCGTISVTADLTIDPGPDASISYDNSPYCASAGIANVTLTGTPGGTYSSTAGLAIDPTTGQIDLSASIPGSYIVYYNVSLGACLTTARFAVDVTPVPNASISYPSSSYCPNAGIATVNVTGTTGGFFTADPGLTIDPVTGDVDLSSSTAGTYTVTYKIPASGGCDDFITTTDITVLTAPDATIRYPLSAYCTGAGVASVLLSGTTGGIFSSASGLAIDPATGDIDLGASTPGDYTVTYVFNSGTCGDFHTSTDVTVTASPSPSISYPGTPFCSTAGAASANVNGSGTGTFTADPGLMIDSFTGEVDLAGSTPGTYTVTYTESQNGCTVSTTADITVTAPPSATINYAGSPYNQSAGIATVTLDGQTGGTFSADPGLVIDASTGEVDLMASTPGDYVVRYTVTPGPPCGDFTTTASITVNVGFWTGAQQKDNGVQLNWNAMTLKSIDHFNVERSANGTSFNSLATVTAVRNNWFDMNPQPGTNFYRVKAENSQGEVKYSSVVALTLNNNTDPGFTVFPNPVNGRTLGLLLTNLEPGTYMMGLFNKLGQQVFTAQLQHTDGKAYRSVDIGNIGKGSYELILTGENNKRVSKRIIKN